MTQTLVNLNRSGTALTVALHPVGGVALNEYRHCASYCNRSTLRFLAVWIVALQLMRRHQVPRAYAELTSSAHCILRPTPGMLSNVH
jgi:hypothetical protein